MTQALIQNPTNEFEGVYDLTIEQYHSGPGVSRSALMEFKKSPLHYWDKFINPDKPVREKPEIINVKDSLDFGNAAHTFILENREFDRRYCVMPEIDRRTTEGKKIYAEVCKNLNGRELISDSAFSALYNMRKSITRDPFADGLITDALYEHSLYWTDKDTGILCKVRPDIWHQNMVCDLKTAADADGHSFSRSTFSYGYHIQAAMIHEALYNLFGTNMTKFMFIVVEKTRPYAVGVHELDEYALMRGVEEFKDLLHRLKDCREKNLWPSYPRTLIGVPAYYQ